MEYLLGGAFLGLGAILGSFVGVVAERVHTGQSFATGRSRCNSCARPLGTLDLVPIVSWLIARGRCFSCGSRIPALYLVLEAVLGTLFLLAYFTLGLTLLLPVFLAALTVIAFIVVYDLRHTVVPTVASNLLVVIGLVYAYLSTPSLHAFGIVLLTAGVIALAFFLLHALSGGRAMGLGDAPVALALSLLVGSYAVGGLMLSFWIGAVVGIVVLVLRSGGPRMGVEVPFVPFLALGYLIAFFLSWNPLTIMLP